MNTRDAIMQGGRVVMFAAAIGGLLPACQRYRPSTPVSVATSGLAPLEQSFAGEPPPQTPPVPAPVPTLPPSPAPDLTSPPLPLPTEKAAVAAYPVAKPVPGREGVVFSPFNNRLVDVSGWKSGTLVNDPRYPESEKKYFRVP